MGVAVEALRALSSSVSTLASPMTLGRASKTCEKRRDWRSGRKSHNLHWDSARISEAVMVPYWVEFATS